MTIWGRTSGHLMRARETLLAHDSTSTVERIAIEAFVVQIDLLIIAVRRIHHDTNAERRNP